MAKEQYIASLDIGTQNIRAIQAKFDSETGSVAIVGAASSPALGMRKGVIVDIEEAVSSITGTLEKLERMTGVQVVSATVSVGGSHVACLESKGVIAVSKADGEITDSDIIRVIDASQAISIPPNREVLHVIPKSFTLDGQVGIKDPLGMTGIRLEVETIIVHGGIPFIKNLNKAMMQAGLEIDDLVLAPLAASTAVLSRRQKELGVVLVDLGAGTTSIAVYEENNLLHTAVLPVGSMHITNDIAIGLRCSIDTAEKVKLGFGHALTPSIDVHQSIDLSKIDPEETETVRRLEVVEIIEARLEEIFEYVNKELKTINRDGKLPAGIVLTGGGSNLPGITEFAKKELRLPAQLGMVENVQTIIDKVEDPSFATVVGLALWGEKFAQGAGSRRSLSANMGKLFENESMIKLKKWFKSFLP
jgi:cell division protein FtsA